MKHLIVTALIVCAGPAWACDLNCQQQRQIDDLQQQLDAVKSQLQPSYHYRNPAEADAAIIRYYGGGPLPLHAWEMLSPEGQKKWKPSSEAYPPVRSPCEDSPTDFYKKLFCSSAGK